MVFTRRQSRAKKDSAQDANSSCPLPSYLPTTPIKSSIAKLSSKSTGAKKANASKVRLHGCADTASTASLVATVDHGVDLISILKSQQASSQGTPHNRTPVKPSSSEMHPHHHKKASNTPYDEAQWLGFFNMQPQTEPKQVGSKIYHALPESPTPIKVANKALTTAPNAQPKFEFTFRREASLGLSPEAKAVMDEHRAEASRIRAQLAAEAIRESEHSNQFLSATGRRFAKPKGRYSDAHNAAFNKMDSIANHPSASRGGPDNCKSKVQPGNKPTHSPHGTAPGKGFGTSPLKRTRSKVDLSDASQANALPPPAAARDDDFHASGARGAKRMKKTMRDEASTSRLQPEVEKHLGNVHSNLLTPTKASLARSQSVSNLNRLKFPSLVRTNSVATLKSPSVLRKTPSKPKLVSNLTSPTKASIQRSSSIKDSSSTPIKESDTSNIVAPLSHIRTPQPHDSMSETLPAVFSPSPVKVQNMQTTKAPPLPYLGSPEPSSQLTKIKSILRTPQRLYSNDPGKIAAGTHLATPPDAKRYIHATVPATAPVTKHVDFSASALLKAVHDEAKAASAEPEITYPILPISEPRRQTVGFPSRPGDFTFRAGDEIKFGPVPASTIRAVKNGDDDDAMDVDNNLLAKRKRLIDAEKDNAFPQFDEEKENDVDTQQDARPAKRPRVASSNIVQKMKNVVKKARTAPPSSRIPKRTGGLSASRLAFLAQPKTRK